METVNNLGGKLLAKKFNRLCKVSSSLDSMNFRSQVTTSSRWNLRHWKQWEKLNEIALVSRSSFFWCDDISRIDLQKLYSMLCVISRVKRRGKKKSAERCVGREKRESCEESLFWGGEVFHSSCSGFLWCALFFSLNIIIPPHGKPSACTAQQLIPNFTLIVVSVDVSLFSTISAVFISILLLFNQLLILFFFLFSLFFGAKSFTNFYSLFIRVRTTTAKSCSRCCCCCSLRRCIWSCLTDNFSVTLERKIFRIKE